MATFDKAYPIKCRRPYDHPGCSDKLTNCFGTHCTTCEVELLRDVLDAAIKVNAQVKTGVIPSGNDELTRALTAIWDARKE